jgi:hypothetical protein
MHSYGVEAQVHVAGRFWRTPVTECCLWSGCEQDLLGEGWRVHDGGIEWHWQARRAGPASGNVKGTNQHINIQVGITLAQAWMQR